MSTSHIFLIKLPAVNKDIQFLPVYCASIIAYNKLKYKYFFMQLLYFPKLVKNDIEITPLLVHNVVDTKKREVFLYEMRDYSCRRQGHQNEI